MDINKGAQQNLSYPDPRFNEKGCLQVGFEMVLPYTKTHCMEVLTPSPSEWEEFSH
jgi:hypothetical protein